jgi:hypothetical protein
MPVHLHAFQSMILPPNNTIDPYPTDNEPYRKETIEHRTRELEQEIRLIEEKLKNEKSVSCRMPDEHTQS